MNKYLYDYGISVYQKDFEWFVIKNWLYDNPTPFKDGMEVEI